MILPPYQNSIAMEIQHGLRRCLKEIISDFFLNIWPFFLGWKSSLLAFTEIKQPWLFLALVQNQLPPSEVARESQENPSEVARESQENPSEVARESQENPSEVARESQEKLSEVARESQAKVMPSAVTGN